MMTLLETQRTVAAALMAPLRRGDRMARRSADGAVLAEAAARVIKPNSRLSSLERLEIYSRSYWFRLLDSLRDDFPGLAAILGPAGFERLARAYLADCPSQSFTLRDVGSRLEAWLQAHSKYAGGNPRLALDMVRLEWAHIVAFDGPAGEVLRLEDVAELKPRLRVGVQPYISLLRLQYPVDDIRIRCNADREGSAAASHVALRKTRRAMPQWNQPRRAPIFLAVHRLDLSVYYRRMSAGEFDLLSALRSGQSIAGAIHSTLRHSSVIADDIPGMLKVWFATWTEFGWLTARRRNRGGTH